MSEVKVQCRACKTVFTAKPARNFLSMPKFACPHCRKTVLLPLSSGVRVAYLVIATLGAYAWYQNLNDLFVWFGAGAALGLLWDLSVRLELRSARLASSG